MLTNMRFKMDSVTELQRTRKIEPYGPVQEYIDNAVMRKTDKYVPLDTGDLKNSASLNTKLGSGEVVYATPYARRLYYSQGYTFDQGPLKGAFWFERMKADHKEDILRGAIKLAKGGG